MKRCANCINPEGQPLESGGYWLDNSALLEEIKGTSYLSGVTVSGGEPFLQAEALSELVDAVKSETDLDIMIYSGYTLAELRALCNPAVDKILDKIDLLIDGEYVEGEDNGSLYRGSDNQTVHFLSPKYRPFKEIIEKSKNRSMEFVVRNEGDLFMVGLPPKGFYRKLVESAKALKRQEEQI